ncbi:phage related tail protein [Escherichia coli]|nr:phage related tail protein [Escherichia coli]
MKTIFGEEASSAAAVLMTAASTGKLDKLTAAFKASDGKTAELVNIMQDNLGGDFKEFQSAYEAVGTDLFDQQEGALRNLTQTATKYVLKLDGWIQKKQITGVNHRPYCRWRTGAYWHHRCNWSCSLAGYHRH